MKKEKRTIYILFISLFTFFLLSCGGKSISNVNAAYAEGEKEAIVEEFRNSYVCLESGMTIKEAEEEKATCESGVKLLKLITLMVEKGWQKDEIQSYNKLFLQGRAMYEKVNIANDVLLEDDLILGDPKAPVTIVEFTDYQCPYCLRFFSDTFPKIKKEYIETGKVRFVTRDYPLPFHQNAQKAHEATTCAREQEKFWEMKDKVFNSQKDLSVEKLKELAKEVGLDAAKFNECLDSGKFAQEVTKDKEDGTKAGVQGTPGFIIGKTTTDKEFKGVRIAGAYPFEHFKSIIEKFLK